MHSEGAISQQRTGSSGRRTTGCSKPAELTFYSYAISQFEDSFALQLAMLQKYVRTTPMRRRREAPDHAALVERVQIMLTISRLLDRASRRLGEQAQVLDQLAEAAHREAQGQQDPQDN